MFGKRGANMSKSQEVENKPQGKKQKHEKFTITFIEFEITEHAVFTAEMSLVETYYCDIIAEFFQAEQEER